MQAGCLFVSGLGKSWPLAGACLCRYNKAHPLGQVQFIHFRFTTGRYSKDACKHAKQHCCLGHRVPGGRLCRQLALLCGRLCWQLLLFCWKWPGTVSKLRQISPCLSELGLTARAALKPLPTIGHHSHNGMIKSVPIGDAGSDLGRVESFCHVCASSQPQHGHIHAAQARPVS